MIILSKRIGLVCLCLLSIVWCAVDEPEDLRVLPDGKADMIGTDSSPSLFRPGNRYGWGGEDAFLDGVLPVFAKRCASCHGCVDSPCQLKLTSYEGIRRGSNESNVFGSRLSPADQTRLQDGRVTDDFGLVEYMASEEEWRGLEFYPVIENGQNSVMYALLDDAHTTHPDGGLSQAFELYEDGLSSRSFQCVGPDAAGPNGPRDEDLVGRSMPFGCPRLEDEHFETLAAWLEEGAPGPTWEAQALLSIPMNQDVVDRWEQFFNQQGERAPLVSRYLYEHLFFARLHFPESRGDFYEIVRSWTPPGQPIVEIVTEFPNDDPMLDHSPNNPGGNQQGVQIYYRLRKYTALVVQKNHITWALDNETQQRWQDLFYNTGWGDEPIGAVAYGSQIPFEYFESIPSTIRARFMLESSFHLIDGMVRGDVCTGSTATWAIRDLFWVWFLDPSSDPSAIDPRLGQEDWEHLISGADGADGGRERDYLEAFEAALRQLHPTGLSIDDLWDGQGSAHGSTLTVLRHSKSATVHPGAIGGMPQTFWLLSYSNFERLYYSLVVNFNPWGTLLHRMDTWEYMGYVRAEGEDLFLSMLPEMYRSDVRDEWQSGFGRVLQDFFFDNVSEGRPSEVAVGADRPVEDLVDQINAALSSPMTVEEAMLNSQSAQLEPLPQSIYSAADFEAGLATLTGWRAPFARYLPNLTVVRFGGQTGRVYTIYANRGYEYHNVILFEDLARVPEEDTLSVSRGLIGVYPELFVDVPIEGALAFLEDLRAVASEDDWARLVFERGFQADPSQPLFIRRDSPAFWEFLDWLHVWNVATYPEDSGLLDVSEYIWPDLATAGTPLSDDALEPNDQQGSAVQIGFGETRHVLCDNDDWFFFDTGQGGILAIEVAFDPEHGDVDAALMGPGVDETSRSYGDRYEHFNIAVPGGRYDLRVDHALFNGGDCQNYTIFASLHQ